MASTDQSASAESFVANITIIYITKYHYFLIQRNTDNDFIDADTLGFALTSSGTKQ